MVALLIGTYELNAMFVHKGWHPPLLFSAALGIDFLLAAMFFIRNHDSGQLVLMIGCGISAFLILTFAWLILTRGAVEGTLIDWALTMASAFYLGWPIALLIAAPRYYLWCGIERILVAAGPIFHDLGQRHVRVTGRALLWARPSSPLKSVPAKTWEGFFGGLVFTVIASYVFTILLPSLFHHPLPVDWLNAAILGVLVAIASTVGDLAESLLKRGTDVKDSGTIVPGHGGLLDRMDSLLFVVMVVFFYAVFLHGIPL